ncbi:M14 family zinc carboxypeptidase [Sporosarcina sp. NPDC096371]|uniref:M14 family zinc carboxypeptidase n=1 Tax=Sporosarcina sp. NPDC096371 TaxID=3364530 RepID=UPI00381747EF
MKTTIWGKIVSFAAILMILLMPISGTSAAANTAPDWMSNEDLAQRLNAIEEASNGNVEVTVMGQTSQGNDIYAARVGTGKQVLMINGNIHGNEKSGPEAVVSLLETLAGDSAFAKSVRDKLTIVAVPRFNPDGAALTQRQNVFPWQEVIATYPQLENSAPAWYYNARNSGFDVNRDFSADLNYVPRAEDFPGTDLDPGFFITSESQALRDLYLDLKVEFGHVEAFVDLHHMGTPVTNKTGEPATIAIDYPPLGPADSGKYDEWALLDQEKSKRYALAAALGVKELSDQEENGVVQYVHFQERDYPGQARSAFALNGTASVLFEMPGQQPQVGYDQALIDRVENGLWGIINRMVDGSIDELNSNDFLEIPKYWTDNTTDMKDLIGLYTKQGAINTASASRILANQLAVLEQFENAGNAEKMVKHLESFKTVLSHYRQQGVVTSAVYNRLNGDANLLLNRWNSK